MNKMKVSSFSFPSLPEGTARKEGQEWRLVVEAVAGNSTANLAPDSEGKLTKPLGNPTESALLIWLEENGESYKARRAEFKVLGQLTFSTERKYMATVGEGVLKGSPSLHVKGAPEIVLGKCSSRRLPDGSAAPLSQKDRESLQEALRDEQVRGMRTLGLAVKPVPGTNYDGDGDFDELSAD